VKISAREKKILCAGAVIAVAIMIYYAATLFIPSDGESLAERVTTQENLLRRQRELIAREDFFKTHIEDAENAIERIQSRLLPGNNVSIANTELQRILSDFADRSGVIIQSRNPLPERKVADSDSLVKVSVRVQLNCSLEDLVDFLIHIKNYDRFLRVEEMQINTATQSKQMVVRTPLNMVVAGYISVPPPPESAAKPGETLVQTTTARDR
jgi:type II secretory pathway component PulM